MHEDMVRRRENSFREKVCEFEFQDVSLVPFTGYVRSLRLRACLNGSPSVLAAPRLADTDVHQCVDGQLGASEEICHLCGRVESDVAHEDVGANSGSTFPAHTGHGCLQRPTSAPRHFCCCTSCTVVAKGVKWTAAPTTAKRQGEGQTKSARSTR